MRCSAWTNEHQWIAPWRPKLAHAATGTVATPGEVLFSVRTPSTSQDSPTTKPWQCLLVLNWATTDSWLLVSEHSHHITLPYHTLAASTTGLSGRVSIRQRLQHCSTLPGSSAFLNEAISTLHERANVWHRQFNSNASLRQNTKALCYWRETTWVDSVRVF